MRVDYPRVAPGATEAHRALENYIRTSGLEPSLLEVLRLRASQINGCGFCFDIDMHTKNARAIGESEQRLYAVTVWRDTPFFTDRERAALAWTEAITQVSWQHVPDEIYELARRHFSEKELIDLTMAVIAINGWNRLSIGFRREAGTYQPHTQAGTCGSKS